ncbi:MFS transporter [Actinosynnema sp. CS-041913]|uniref:MFS transporter n=1 Tax=Actinosynnema sp. CS-041913 TaxID=3239917 RepID=UPI003D937152
MGTYDAGMLAVLRVRTYRHLFAAQVVALTGTGLATVALGLLAYRLAGPDAGAVLGTALAIKMIAYVTVAPLAGAIAGRLPRRGLLVGLDLVRAAVAVVLPWVGEIWQVYLLIFLLQAASAAFTPAFQATVPDVLPDERDYTRALTLSRLAYDLESLLSPALAAAVLLLVSFENLFLGTAIGFVASALLVVSVVLPGARPQRRRGLYEGTTRGIRIYLSTPRLRGLLAVHLAVAAAGSMVLVNTVVYVRDVLGREAADVAFALAANGIGSLLAALALPRLLDRVADRAVVLRASVLLAVAMFAGFGLVPLAGGWHWSALLLLWAVVGAGSSMVLTPGSRLLRRSADPGDFPVLFAADFALSHACWLLCYPLAGWLATVTNTTVTFAVLGAITLSSSAVAMRLWPRHDPECLEHVHDDLDPDHHHLQDAVPAGGVWRHTHTYRIDDFHDRWPR